MFSNETSALPIASMNRSKLIFLFVVLIGVGIVLTLQSIALVTIYSHQGYETDRSMPPAVLTAMAVDLVNGVFYRPLSGADGYGGTRYMPLYVIGQAGLIQLGLSPMAASWALAICSLAILLGCIYFLLRELQVERTLAIGGTLLALLSFITQFVFCTMRPDMLAAAFNIAGLALAVRIQRRAENNLLLSSTMILCFLLAMLTKVSMIFGFIAVVLVFFYSGRRRQALYFTLALAGTLAISLVLIQLVSKGQFLASFMATGSANGSLKDIAKAPLQWLKHNLSAPGSFFIILLAWAGLGCGAVAIKRDLLSLCLVFTSFVVIFLFGSPGVSYNHILDLYLIAVIYLVVRINNSEIQPRFALVCLTLIAVFSTTQIVSEIRGRTRTYQAATKLSETQRILAQYRAGTANRNAGPILADNPWLPILMGERPYVIDQFMLGVLNEKFPENLKLFRRQIEQHFFRAVVLENPQVQLFHPEQAESYMGYNLTDHLLQHYKIVGQTTLGVILVPKNQTQVNSP